MKVPLILVLVGSVINLLLLGLGIVTAFFLRLVFPSIEWGNGGLDRTCVLCLLDLCPLRNSDCCQPSRSGALAREDQESPPEKEEQPSKLEYRRAWYLPSVYLPTRPTRRRSR